MTVKQLWRWQGVNDKGQLEQDVVWVDNRLALIITLQHQRIMPLRIKRMGVNAALWKEEQSAEIIHQLATLIHAGLTLSEGLELPCETASPPTMASAVAHAGSRA
ncbi:type IV pilin biogenesis protein [Salmonella enterica subsp. arizonae]|uniref:Type IV pilin biogenesis protein n=1 Tax=Salmonella enterica subsp. arizonae TaxID=59203 RepID=A0A379TH38_SALER|nr:type IV pilin biogenesis protein [Salmonella enterica subsp. arizonae]